MAQSVAKKGFGTLFAMGNSASPEVFTKCAEVRSVKQTGAKYDELDVTHMESPNGVKEFILGLVDEGAIDITVNFTNVTSQAAVKTAQGTRVNFILQFPQLPTPMQLSFSGLVGAFNYDATPTAQLQATFNIKIVSPLTESAVLTSLV